MPEIEIELKKAGLTGNESKIYIALLQYGEEGANSLKGDVTEVFAEYVLKGYGRTWGIYNYVPFFSTCGDDQDVGVDGTGTTKDGRIVTVQVKYGNWSISLDHIKRKLLYAGRGKASDPI